MPLYRIFGRINKYTMKKKTNIKRKKKETDSLAQPQTHTLTQTPMMSTKGY